VSAGLRAGQTGGAGAAASGLRAAGKSDVGRQRDVNEDRFHVDVDRGVFIVVDGVGGQAAGGKAADTAVSMLRERLERETGATADRVREAITLANNEIHRQAALRPEWRGMACVLTVVVVQGDRAVVGHVGDTRLYSIHGQAIEKVTPDHSPVGEREDAHEISEREAMRHPRRNEVYRDVGSDPHTANDPDFLYLTEMAVPPGSALLLCSDGLTDLVPSETIRQIAVTGAGQPAFVVDALVEAANDAGGKDNVTVVYVERDRAGGSRADGRAPEMSARTHGAARPARLVRALVASAVILAALGAVSIWQFGWPETGSVTGVLGAPGAGAIVVRPNESIMAAMERAQPGFDVVVEPGEYRERLTLKDNVRVISRVPRGATLRLPGLAAEGDAAVVAAGITGGELAGFRILGDAATPLGVGVITRDATVRLVDLDVSGATTAAFDLGAGDGVVLIGSDVRDNPGAALLVRGGATPRVAHNTFARNGTSERAPAQFVVERAAQPVWWRNVFHGLAVTAVVGIDDATRTSMSADNWFVGSTPVAPPVAGRGRRGP
jgi:serine/threonine protein phosphatase PrpC